MMYQHLNYADWASAPSHIMMPRILSLLRRSFAVLTPEIFWPLYLALGRPIMEYSQQASSPYQRWDIALMKRTQRQATRMVECMKELPNEDRLHRLNIFSLERCRLRGDLILAYKIFLRRRDLPQAEFFEAPLERDLQGHDNRLRQHTISCFLPSRVTEITVISILALHYRGSLSCCELSHS